MIYWQDMVRFIRIISRIRLDSDQRAYIRKFCTQDVPWEQLILFAEAEGVDGLLYHHLCRFDESTIPEPARNRLQANFCAHQNFLATILNEAERISRLLEQNGLSAIALQGVSLLDIYETPGLRPMGDIDLLIKPDQYPYVAAYLREIGFFMPHPAYPKNLRKGLLWLDIHTHILNLDRIRSRRYIFPENLSDLWNRAKKLFTSSAGLLTPDPLDSFVLLSAHAFKHNYCRMIWLVDLFECVNRIVSVPHGWENLIDRVRSWRQERIVMYGLTVLEGILGLVVPVWVKDALNAKELGSIEKYLLRLRVRSVYRPEYYVLLCFFAIKGVRKKLEFIIESMFPRDEIMVQIYLMSPERSRFYQILHRLIQTASSVGSGLRQGLSTNSYSRK